MLPPRRRRGPARPGSPGVGTGWGSSSRAAAGWWLSAARKRVARRPARTWALAENRAGRGRRGRLRRGGSAGGGGGSAGEEDARRSPREPRFCECWPLTYGNDARAGPHSRPFEGRPPGTPAPAAKYCPASGALTKRPSPLCRALEAAAGCASATERPTEGKRGRRGPRELLLRGTMGCPRCPGVAIGRRVGGASASRVAGHLGGAPALRPRLALRGHRSSAGAGHLRTPQGPRPHRRLKAATVCRSRTGLASWREQKGWWFCCLVPPRQHCD